MEQCRKISLVLADVDGTLLDSRKVLTDRARVAVQALHDAGIRFAIASGRPPRGMAMLFDPLQLDTPISGFNGGLFVERDLSIIEHKTIPSSLARDAIDVVRRHDLDVWIYRGNDWLISKADAPHVAREIRTVKFQPRLVSNLDDHLDQTIKIVAISDDGDRMQRCEAEARTALGHRATVARSQPYYLDITHEDANKGAVVGFLSRALGVPSSEIASIGDQPTDVLMFERSGFSIAMGNASAEVKSRADATTDSHEHEGFARAMEHFVLDAME